ncbi:alpha-xenorhabdolysin family binary toxin subunit A [Aneurinibacillus migulanus]|uniref:alpha-xenorhabdolysin family binary toxin subunit A n=1 Tax=Aneurinibacillus migulanus TaxID=47500 RepID=UPI002E1B4D13|nr:alpha-xenorhabdolysin family binary toxin subunit A [Aneurinibacillus migulanus]MED4728319.1 alpha-xenorhabdolysin family binary toxin subunit A [Aneurinibacillus migulanus]
MDLASGMLPKVQKANHVLAPNQPYGPQGFAGKGGFILSKEEWASAQAHILTGMGLPVNDVEMRRHVGLSASTEIPSDFQKLYDVYNEVKHLCSWWNTNLFPLIIKIANDIASYGYKVAGTDEGGGYFDKLQVDLKNISLDTDESGKQSVFKDFQARCAILIKEAHKFANDAETVRAQVATFLNGGQDSQGNDVIGVRQIQQRLKEVKEYLDARYGESSPEHQQLIREIDEMKKSLEQAIKAEHELEQKVKMSFILGPLLGFIVYEMLKDTAVKEVKQRIDAFQQSLNKDAVELQRDVKIIGMLHSIDSDIDNLIAQGEESIKVLEKIAGIWSSISSHIHNLQEIVLQELENTDTDELTIEIMDAAAAWRIIADEAREFVLNAYTA